MGKDSTKRATEATVGELCGAGDDFIWVAMSWTNGCNNNGKKSQETKKNRERRRVRICKSSSGAQRCILIDTGLRGGTPNV